MKFCFVNCPYLSPKEREQSEDKEPHRCKRYGKQVKHLGHHPRLVRLGECGYQMMEPIDHGRETLKEIKIALYCEVCGHRLEWVSDEDNSNYLIVEPCRVCKAKIDADLEIVKALLQQGQYFKIASRIDAIIKQNE